MFWHGLLTNKVLLLSVSAWFIAQSAKFIIFLIREKQVRLRYLVASGGMPSAHSAVVSALSTSVALTLGPDSVAFGITAILALIVMYDAAGVRRAVSRQSVILDRLVKESSMKRPRGELERDLRELVGHTPVQVIVGGLLGITVAWIGIIISSP